MEYSEKELWQRVEAFFTENFDAEPHPPLESVLFLIGVRELGQGGKIFSKDDKLNLIHIAVCRVLEPYGFYLLEGKDQHGWPQYKTLEPMPELKANEQSILMKKAIIQYFLDEDLWA